MFGIIRPCRHRLPGGLGEQWLAHLCGLCLALRTTHGQAARLATNYDGLLISVLYEAQAQPPEAGAAPWRRTAGPCPLRGMRTASVARGEGAALAAAVSLVLASAKLRDHAVDGDGLLRRRSLAAAAGRVARGWERAGARGGAAVGFDAGLLTEAIGRQQELEAAAVPGGPLLAVTEPTETATAAAFAHTARLAGRPGNARALAEAGRYFGRLAHLLDAVEDQRQDAADGSWNPLTATGTSRAEARRLCDDAVLGVRLALAEAELRDQRLVHVLLVHELRRAVDRAFAGPGGRTCGHPATAESVPGLTDPPGLVDPPDTGRRRRGWAAGCLVWAGMFCTCQVCCREDYPDPWTGKERHGCCHYCDCCSGCDTSCCSCCSCGEDSDDGGCCDSCDCNCGCDC
ncbi:hypothetical protein HUT13_04285 [Streptomyces harbinensis]|uniref:DUF5685 family protein n=1 Tax=Streptomyces harbinensis TaxID=1176198 RepID=UPI0015906BFD|nr:DUF5685 family protein [Streptomyces harbinensis]QKV68078.1 hypothetical protein HUT13_04285 [Streptomyces harbinensis]